MQTTDIPNFDRMTDLERLELADELIASVRDRETLPPPVSHRLELERRWAEFEKDPTNVLSLEQFWAEVRSKKG